MSIRGLRRTFYPPNQHIAIDNSPPDKKLRLQWVHGYRGRDTHKNLWVLPSGELLYYVAAVAVLYDRDEGTQRHYTGHTEDIITYGSQNQQQLPFFKFIFPLFSAVWTFIHRASQLHLAKERALIVNHRHTFAFGVQIHCKRFMFSEWVNWLAAFYLWHSLSW